MTAAWYGMPSADQDDLIFCVTDGRSSHASDLTVGEEALVHQFAANVRDGRMSIGDVHRAAQEFRDKQLGEQLEQSVAQAQPGDAAVADFDRAIQEDGR